MRAYGLIVGATCASLAVAGGCDSGYNRAPYYIGWPPQVSIAEPPSGLSAGDEATFNATWAGGTAPFTVVWAFGGGALPDTVSEYTAGTASVQTVILSNSAGGDYVVTVTVTDAQNLPSVDSDTFTYAPTSSSNSGPHLQLLSGAGTDTVTLRATDADGDSITIYTTPPIGLSLASPPSALVESGGTATFTFAGDDMFVPEGGDAGFSAFDGHSASPVLGVPVHAGYELLPDTLYAIPLKTHAAVDEPVRIIIATGVPAHPFQFMNGVRLTALAGFRLVSSSFNTGALGGSSAEVDGLWNQMGNIQWLLGPDDWLFQPLDLGDGRTAIDVSVTPIGGHDLNSAKGALFNVEATFAAGVNVLGFQEVQEVNRTYYSDGAATEYFWGDITNDHPGVPNSVTVE